MRRQQPCGYADGMAPEIVPQIIVERDPSQLEWTLSNFFINGVHKGVGVEDEHREVKIKGETRVANNIYELELRHSPKFSKSYFVDTNGNLSTKKDERFTEPHQLIWVKNVKDFEYVLWHWGNSDLDTDACYIVGSYFGNIQVVNPKTKLKESRRGVISSRIKYVEIYPIIYAMIQNNKANGITTYVQYMDKVIT